MSQTTVNAIIASVLDSCIKVHAELGPGLYESVYEEVLIHELTKRAFVVKRQVPIPVVYDYIKFGIGFRLDLLVNDRVVVEIKSVEAVAPIHFKQLHAYLKLAGFRDGVLVNFNANLLKDGFYRRFNNHSRKLV
ncbi:MAG: GxxExxY protein [Chitinophagaceae bacterium]|nr:GxxExxY protein [Chitinophagaceae bacterium]